MDTTTRRRLELRARVLRALASPARIWLVEQLTTGPRCVCELAGGSGLDVSTVSRHLARLREAGIVRGDRQGNQVVYELRARCALRFLDCVEEILALPAEEEPA